MDMTVYLDEAPARDIVAEEHWARKGDVDLYLYRKYPPDAPPSGPRSEERRVGKEC